MKNVLEHTRALTDSANPSVTQLLAQAELFVTESFTEPSVNVHPASVAIPILVAKPLAAQTSTIARPNKPASMVSALILAHYQTLAQKIKSANHLTTQPFASVHQGSRVHQTRLALELISMLAVVPIPTAPRSKLVSIVNVKTLVAHFNLALQRLFVK